MLLLCEPLRRRGEGLAVKLLAIQLTASYFWFSHSIVGIREPVLAFAATLAAWWLERAFRTRKTGDYVGAFVACAAVPLVKTSGVFMPAAFALTLAWKLFLRDGSVPRRGLWAGLGAAAAFWAGVLALWWGPNWLGVREFYDLEVVSRANPDALGSFGRLAAMLAVAAPGLLLLSALSGARAADAALSDRRRVDDWDLILLSWALCAAPPLIYPVQGYWRWLMWLYPALAGLAAREWARWCARGLDGEPRSRRASSRLAAAFAAAVVVMELPYYAKHVAALDFKLLRLTRETEAVVGDALVSGSNFEDMSAFSPKLNFVSALMGLRLRSCEEVRRAFPYPAKTPVFLAEYAGTSPDAEVASRFYAGCPEWKRQFKALARVPSPQTEGLADLWFVREHKAPFIAGANYPWSNYGTDFGASAWGHQGISDPKTRRKVSEDLAFLKSKGVTVVRWFLFADGRSSPEFDAAGRPSGLDDRFFADFDAALELAREHGLKLMPVLFDFLLFDPPKVVNGAQLGGRGRIVTDPRATDRLIETVLQPLFRRYAREPAIYAWDLFNEPELRIRGVRGPGPRPAERARVFAFVKRVTALIHAEARHPVTLGSWKRSLVGKWKGAGLDLYQFHHYEDGFAEPFDRPYAELGLDKPCLVGEFPTKRGKLAVEAYLEAARRNGYAGALAWSYRGGDSFSDFAGQADRFAAWVRAARASP